MHVAGQFWKTIEWSMGSNADNADLSQKINSKLKIVRSHRHTGSWEIPLQPILMDTKGYKSQQDGVYCLPSLSCVLDSFFSSVPQRVVTPTGSTPSAFTPVFPLQTSVWEMHLGKARTWHLTTEKWQGSNCISYLLLSSHVPVGTFEMEMRALHVQSLPSAEGTFSWP